MDKLNRIRSGIPGLDKMLRGGIIEGSITLIEGHSGTGKTMFGLQFLKSSLENNKKCIYI
ncbi:MAG: hypothetical protein A2452_04565 [Candidatus Firestonebacteria bacterium RIFOXYC2_FULL_39_67]|nr:MAG: hypothetical protein A2536_11535 [Candidatus Firestonebacteria bacterium RIFOXYD2_FULL_39_29]OGF53216.1 MAG: hypothetical protein A2497_04800 [Candidatus Firestonebacteria bacterium RifOxyC12_full_39_7]OGF55861.1 MAG: hypothetical protein A2452_04565 [Candidatus Firestonebacteria bacterium RIFOXYC2_FULL_39_67]